jgi:hypothetical protein
LFYAFLNRKAEVVFSIQVYEQFSFVKGETMWTQVLRVFLCARFQKNPILDKVIPEDKVMKRSCLSIGAVVFFMLLLGFSGRSSAQEVTIAGTVNADFEIVTENGEKYYIEEGAVGDELAMHIGKKALATGKVLDLEGERSIVVTDFRLMDEAPKNSEKEQPKIGKESGK